MASTEAPTLVSTDADLLEEELSSLPTPKPMGHFITPIFKKDYALVSKRQGKALGYFESIDMAVPFMRMLYRERVRPCADHDGERAPGGLDFRLYLYDRRTCCWMVAICRLELPEGYLGSGNVSTGVCR